MTIQKNLTMQDACLKLQNLLSTNGGSIRLNSIGSGTRFIIGIKACKIVYTQGANKKVHYFDLKLFVDTYTALNGKRVDRTVLENYNPKYKSRPCNVLIFMLLVNLIYGIPIQGAGTKHNQFFI